MTALLSMMVAVWGVLAVAVAVTVGVFIAKAWQDLFGERRENEEMRRHMQRRLGKETDEGSL